jgi:hypothetical protein
VGGTVRLTSWVLFPTIVTLETGDMPQKVFFGPIQGRWLRHHAYVNFIFTRERSSKGLLFTFYFVVVVVVVVLVLVRIAISQIKAF